MTELATKVKNEIMHLNGDAWWIPPLNPNYQTTSKLKWDTHVRRIPFKLAIPNDTT